MKCKISLITIITIQILVIKCSAQLDKDPVANDPRILKQPPHHWGTPAPDSGIKLDFIPFKVLASVRREETTKHLPREAALAEASTPEEIILAKRLRESITTKKLGEVYTEQGYEDKKYDHGYHEKHGDFKEKYEKFAKANTSKPSQQVNKKDQITRPSNNNKKKAHNNEKTIYTTPKHQSKSEYIEGMLPPPLPRHRYKREQTRQVYSTRRGGVKFSSPDLDGDGSEIDVARIVTSHRVSPDSKYGARDTESRRAPAENTRPRESRTRSRHYEVTELPEEPIASNNNNKFSNRGSSRRNNNNNNNNDNIKVTKEKVYSSTYVPRTNVEDELSPEVTTNAIVPEVTSRYKLDTEIYNTETEQRDIVTEVPFKPEYIAPTTLRAHDSGRSRTRSRTPVAASISEDVFQGRGERRKSELPAKTNSELLRSRNRNTRIKSTDNVKPVETTPPPEEISFDPVTQEPEAFIIPTENIPIVNQAPTESIEFITEKIPTERQSGRQRNTETSRHPTPSERKQNIERQSRPERRQRVRPESEITNNYQDNESTTQRVIQSRDRSSSRRQEAFKSKKQDYTANINFEPSRHTRQRSSGSRGSIDPVENVEQLTDSRRVNRQGSRRALDSSRVEQQEAEAAPAPARRTSRRQRPTEPAAATPAASSTRYQFPGNQPTTLFQDDAGRRYLCIVLEDDLNVDKVVINTKVK